MSSLKARIQFYNTLSTMIGAGLPVVRALDRHPPPSFRTVAQRMAAGIEAGRGALGDMMEQFPRKFSRMECRLVAVGEHTGTLEHVCRSLAEWFETRLRLRREVISRMLYPALVFHAAAVLVPGISVFTGTSTIQQFAVKSATLIAVPWLLLLVIPRMARLLATSGVTWLSRIWLAVPLFGTISRKLDYARFFRAFSTAANAGVGVAESATIGAETCANTALSRDFRRLADAVERDSCPFSTAFVNIFRQGSSEAVVRDLMQTGEQAGQTAEMAERAARILDDEARATMSTAAIIIPTLLYLALVIWMAVTVITLWGGHFREVQKYLDDI